MGFYVTDKVGSGIQNKGINGGKSVGPTIPVLAAVGEANLGHRDLLIINPKGGDIVWGNNTDLTATSGIANSGLTIGNKTSENFGFTGDDVRGVDIYVLSVSGTITVNFAEFPKSPETWKAN